MVLLQYGFFQIILKNIVNSASYLTTFCLKFILIDLHFFMFILVSSIAYQLHISSFPTTILFNSLKKFFFF